MDNNISSYKLEFYITPRGESLVDVFLDDALETHRGKILRWLQYLEKEGPNLPRPYADIVAGKIRELRISIAHHQYRLFYFFCGKTIVITHGILKKTSRVPPREIEHALQYMNDWLSRYNKGGN